MLHATLRYLTKLASSISKLSGLKGINSATMGPSMAKPVELVEVPLTACEPAGHKAQEYRRP